MNERKESRFCNHYVGVIVSMLKMSNGYDGIFVAFDWSAIALMSFYRWLLNERRNKN